MSMATTGTVQVGCWVLVCGGEGEEMWRIVPTEDADALRSWMSERAPLAQAVLGHRVGDRVTVNGPGGRYTVEITGITEMGCRA